MRTCRLFEKHPRSEVRLILVKYKKNDYKIIIQKQNYGD